MKAAMYEGPGQLSIRDVPTPACPDDGVLLRVDACAICGTDMRIWKHGKSNVKPPVVLGHEIAGTVIQKGPKAQADIALGDRIVVGPAGIGCGKCDYCRRGESNLCKTKMIFGYSINGGFAEQVAIPGQAFIMGNAARVPASLTNAQAALMEPLACVVHGQKNIRTGEGDVVVIFGSGPIGCMHVAVAKARGVKRVIMVEPSTDRRELSRRFGADDVVDPKAEDAVARLKELTGGGASCVIVACSVRQAQQQAIEVAARSGRVLFFAGVDGHGSKVEIDSNRIHYEEITVYGSRSSNVADCQESLALLESGKVRADDLLTRELSLEELTSGFETLLAGVGLKQIVVPNGSQRKSGAPR